MVMSGSFTRIQGNTRSMESFPTEEKRHHSSDTQRKHQESFAEDRTVSGYKHNQAELLPDGRGQILHKNTQRLAPPSIRIQQARPQKVYSSPSIVPAGSVTGRSLTLVISIMCFLACLTSIAVYMINESARAWIKDLSSEVTIQIEQRGNETERILGKVADYLKVSKGIKSARPLNIEETTQLLEPWLGKIDGLNALPIPRLIAIELDRGQNISLEVLKQDLNQKFEGVSLDDHRQWQSQIRTLTRSLAFGGITVLLLMAAATTAIIVSATKSSMASNREIIEVLHFVGATDRFISREFEKHFLRLGIRAGCVGATLAVLVFVSIPLLMQTLSGGPSISADIHRLIGSASMNTASVLLLGIVVVIISAICVLTSRIGVSRILNARH